jgi:hypothetical protein
LRIAEFALAFIRLNSYLPTPIVRSFRFRHPLYPAGSYFPHLPQYLRGAGQKDGPHTQE